MASIGNDLANIRKEQELSLDDIHRATKIPVHILHSIEDESIFSDFGENPTYIRSYVRSYAKALSIDEQQIVYALNQKQKDNYQGSLQQLLEETPKKSFELDEDNTEPESTEKDTKDDQDRPEAGENDSETMDKAAAAAVSRPQPNSPNVRSVDWADMGRRFQPLKTTKSKVWVGILVITLLVVGATYIYLYDSESVDISDSSNNPQTEESANGDIVPDSLQLDIVPPAEEDTTEQPVVNDSPQQTAPLSTLPDTLEMVVYAAYGKLEPVRVYSDINDSISPYWIEEGEAVRFEFVNEIRIRGQFSRMALLLNGHPIPDFRDEFFNPDTRLLEIERSYFEGESIWLQAPPDSLAIDAPPPSIIRNRPTFN